MKDKLFSFIDGQGEAIIDLQREMCARPAVSPESDGEGEAEKATFLETYLKKLGAGSFERIDAPDKRAKGGIRPNLIWTIEGRDKSKSVWVISHMDVVPPGDLSLWDASPWELTVKDGVLTGRGVEDNQQGICSSISAVLSLIKNGVTPPCNIKLLFAADEEFGSEYGIDYLVKERKDLFKKGDICIIPDSGSADGAEIEIAEKNLLWLKVTIEGKQVHGSVPDTGINAHYAEALFIVAARALYDKFKTRDDLFSPAFSTFEPTKVEPNVPNINTIPGNAVFYMDCRILPCYPIQSVVDEFSAIAAKIEKDTGAKITLSPVQWQESPATPKDSPLVARLAASIKSVLGVDARLVGIGGGTVAAYLRREGVDCAVWGKLEENAHQVNESARLSNIIDEAKVMADFFMGGGEK